MKHTLAILALTLFATLSQANGLQALEQFLQSTQSGQAQFTQTVVSPLRPGETVARTKTSSGQFEFLRPNRFRFHYAKPFEQTIVADGQTLWLHDVDLNQVTARPQSDALGGTPAGLITSATDLKAVRALFRLTPQPDQDGLRWVLAEPLGRDAQLQSLRLGFRGQELAALEMLDSFGQKSILRFTGFSTQSAPGPERFRFQPPPGADIIRP